MGHLAHHYDLVGADVRRGSGKWGSLGRDGDKNVLFALLGSRTRGGGRIERDSNKPECIVIFSKGLGEAFAGFVQPLHEKVHGTRFVV